MHKWRTHMIRRITFLIAIVAASGTTALAVSRASDSDLARVHGMYTSNRWCHKNGSKIPCVYSITGDDGGGNFSCFEKSGAPCYLIQYGPEYHDLCDVANDISKKCKYDETYCVQYLPGQVSDCHETGAYKTCDPPAGQKPLTAGTRTVCDANGSDLMP
jgi:hypothetical protein